MWEVGGREEGKMRLGVRLQEGSGHTEPPGLARVAVEGAFSRKRVRFMV